MKARKNAMAPDQGPALARFFSAAVIKEFASEGRSELGAKILKDVGFLDKLDPLTTLGSFFDNVYSFLFRSYRAEYGRAQYPSATFSGDNVAWEKSMSS